MNRRFFSLCTLSLTGINAQGLIAGWDFADVPALDTAVNNYIAEKTSSDNNGFTTSGYIETASDVRFKANGYAVTDPNDPRFQAGFDQTTTDLFGGRETGQQSINLNASSLGKKTIVFHFTSAYNVIINADWLTESTEGTADILDIDYSHDGGVNWTPYYKANDQYAALASTSGWTESDSSGFIGFVNSNQSDMTIDLRSVADDVASAVNAVRFKFENLQAGERVGLDNVHIIGTAVSSGTGGGTGDPHLHFAGGRRADFRGVPGRYFSLVSAPGFALNVLIANASFAYADATIHGTYMVEAAVRCGEDALMLHNATNATQWGFGWHAAAVHCHDRAPAHYVHPHTRYECPATEATTKGAPASVSVEYATATFTCGAWTVRSTVQPVARYVAGATRNLDLKIVGPAVGAHGIVGQNLDERTARDGALDVYPTRGEHTTSAQAEGAIDGRYDDYAVATAYATDFRYSRFSGVAVPTAPSMVARARSLTSRGAGADLSEALAMS